MDLIFKDVRYAARGLLKRKSFAALAVLTLALVNAVMLKALPVEKPEELVLFSDSTSQGTSISSSPATGHWNRFSYASYEFLRDHDQSFQGIVALRSDDSPLSVRQADATANAAAQRDGQLVSGNYFSVLGVHAMRGRLLTPEDDKPGAQPAAVISQRYWEKDLNSDPAAVGKNFILNGTSFTVV